MREHGSILLYVHGNHKVRLDGQPRTATSTFTQLLSSATRHQTTSYIARSAVWSRPRTPGREGGDPDGAGADVNAACIIYI